MTAAWYARLQAWLMATLGAHHSRLLAERKQALLGGLRGTIVEIGPGGGVNFEFYAASAVESIGVEPNPFAHARLRAAAAAPATPSASRDPARRSWAHSTMRRPP